MGTVTYPRPEVVAALSAGFATYKLDLKTPHPDFKEAAGRARVPWAPTFVVTEPGGREVRRWVGWLPPAAFVDQLQLARGLAELGQGRFAAAGLLLTTLPESPEARYWAGVAAYRRPDGTLEDLAAHWNELRQRFPQSTWAVRASVIDDAVLGEGGG
jgi:hypothetical protein